MTPKFTDLKLLLDNFITAIMPPLKEAWQTLVKVWQNEISPELAKLWTALKNLFTEIFGGTGKTDGWKIALGILKSVLDEVVLVVHLLTPAIKATATVLSLVIDNVATTINNFVRFKQGIDGIIDAVGRLISKLGELASNLIGLVIPDVLTPGSPTPFEIGLRGIGDAISSMPNLNFTSAAVGGIDKITGAMAQALVPMPAMATVTGGAGTSAKGTVIAIDTITINANSRNEGQEAGAGFISELRSRGLM